MRHLALLSALFWGILAWADDPTVRVKSIAAGGTHSLALMTDGNVWEWGETSPLPVRVNGLSGVKSIATGMGQRLAVKTDGTVWEWGWAPSCVQKRGNPEPAYRDIPERVEGISGAVATTAGSCHSMALGTDGTVWEWGCRTGMADGQTPECGTPVTKARIEGAVAIAAGYDSSFAVRHDGTVWRWRLAVAGYGGGEWEATPRQIAGLNDAVSIAAGQTHVLVLRRDGSVWAWGWNSNGQLGIGTREPHESPRLVEGLAGVVSIAAGADHSLAIRSDGTVWGWGADQDGQLGATFSHRNSDSPGPMKLADRAIAVAGGLEHTIVLGENGDLWACGSNRNGELGVGGTMVRIRPEPVVELSGVTAVSTSLVHNLALRSDGTVWGWGLNEDGQLGDGTFETRSVPMQVRNIDRAKAVAAGYHHSLALREDGTVWQWGLRPELYVWEGHEAGDSMASQVAGVDNVVAIAAGEAHSVILKSDGTVWTWGRNDNGQLGGESRWSRAEPQAVEGLRDVVAVAAGGRDSMALTRGGEVWQWGGWSRRAGAGPPERVQGLNHVVAIAGGGGHSLALKDDGTVWAWGRNWSGQVGDGTIEERIEPVEVLGLREVTRIAGGESQSVALRGDGTVWRWGLTRVPGSLFDRTPRLMDGITGVVEVAAGGSYTWDRETFGHVLAVRRDGAVWSWGDNEYGQLGDGKESCVGSTKPLQTKMPMYADLTLEITHEGSWAPGREAKLLVSVRNDGMRATSGRIMATYELPTGVSYVSVDGDGWGCWIVGAAVTCAREAPLGSGESSAISLTVKLGEAAQPGVLNFARLENEADRNEANNWAEEWVDVGEGPMD